MAKPRAETWLKPWANLGRHFVAPYIWPALGSGRGGARTLPRYRSLIQKAIRNDMMGFLGFTQQIAQLF